MIKADGGQWTARLCFWSVLSHSDAGLQVRESFSLVSKLVWRIELFCVPGRHPSGVHQKHQEDQNCHPVAKRSGDRHHKWQGERNLAASHHDLMNYEKTVFLHMWRSIPKDFFSISGVAVRVCVLLVQRQHLQVFDVDLSSSGGTKGFLFRSTQTCYAFLVFCHVCTARDQQVDIVSRKLGL